MDTGTAVIGRLRGGVGVALRLGRVSNLPTVWSNTVAGAVLGGAALDGGPGGGPGGGALLPVMLAFSLLYVAGMYLNDAFDRGIDARERPGRPIPAGQVTAGTVFAAGFAMLAAGVLLLGLHGLAALAAGLALAGVIVAYDMHHKGNPLSPVVMAACRALVYAGAALALGGGFPAAAAVGAGLLLCYVIGLTYAAKMEAANAVGALWPLGVLAVPFVVVPLAFPVGAVALGLLVVLAAWAGLALSWLLVPGRRNVPRAVGALIAGIALLDGVLVAAAGHPLLGLLAAAACPLTHLFQRRIAGT